MTLSSVKALLQSASIPFTEMEFANEADFLKHIFQNAYTKNTKDHKFYALIIESNNGKKSMELEFEEQNGEYGFRDLWFGDFCFEFFNGYIDDNVLLEEIQDIMGGNQAFIIVSTAKTNRWISDARYDLSDKDNDMFSEVGFHKAMKRIQKNKTFFEKLFGFSRRYEIYDWNAYECIVK